MNRFMFKLYTRLLCWLICGGGIAIIFLLTLITTTGCKKKVVEKEVYVQDTLKYSWKFKPNWNEAGYDQIYSAKGQLILLGMENYISVLDSSNYSPNSWGVAYANPVYMGRRIPINKDVYFTVYGDGKIICYQTSNVGKPISGTLLLKRDVDSSFTNVYKYDLLSASLLNQNAVNDSNYLLVYGYTTTAPKGNFYYIKGKYIEYSATVASYSIYPNIKKISLPVDSLGGYYPPVVQGLKSNFICSYNDTLYLIRPDYSIKKFNIYGLLRSTFTYSNCVYAYLIGPPNTLYKSCDDGENWNLEFYINGPTLYGIVNLGSQIVGMYRDKIYLVTINGASVNFKEMKNDGLEYKMIRGMCLWNGNVWVATNSGLFYKSYDDFINGR